jgi:hypothetical protein
MIDEHGAQARGKRRFNSAAPQLFVDERMLFQHAADGIQRPYSLPSSFASFNQGFRSYLADRFSIPASLNAP